MENIQKKYDFLKNFVHYIKKMLKFHSLYSDCVWYKKLRELASVHYIAKFTISRFVITKFGCIKITVRSLMFININIYHFTKWRCMWHQRRAWKWLLKVTTWWKRRRDYICSRGMEPFTDLGIGIGGGTHLLFLWKCTGSEGQSLMLQMARSWSMNITWPREFRSAAPEEYHAGV